MVLSCARCPLPSFLSILTTFPSALVGLLPSPLQHFSKKLKLNFYFSFNTSWYWNCLKLIEPNPALEECMVVPRSLWSYRLNGAPSDLQTLEGFKILEQIQVSWNIQCCTYMHLTSVSWSFSVWLLGFVHSSSWEQCEFIFVGIYGAVWESLKYILLFRSEKIFWTKV